MSFVKWFGIDRSECEELTLEYRFLEYEYIAVKCR